MGAPVLIVGASRGIGLELVRQYRALGREVLATHRKPEDAAAITALGATPYRIDVTEEAALPGLVDVAEGAKVETVILAAGILLEADRTMDPAVMDEAVFLECMRVNALAPMRLMFQLGHILPRGGRIGVLSTRMASKELLVSSYNTMAYRASKAALNIAVKAAANAYAAKGVAIFAMHPGWVKTDMGGSGAEVEIADSAVGLMQIVERADEATSGGFFNYTGEALPW
ncbi:SDR family NAD(P)-dependent oxidoreductase [Lacibacterium aquatile]|uniref:SDR family NAD(P)-dependent oxidoreductase n=1 Tax=Lacibacterium aquatile TaxID=1168082 RepID=A0ABW5DRU2_9PROT